MVPSGLDSTLQDPDPSPPAVRRRGGSGVHAMRAPRNRCATCGQDFPPSYVVCPRDATPLGVAGQGGDPLVGVVLAGTYRLARTIGRGGMGRLYEAEHTRLDRRFAVKVLHESHADKPEAVRRFEREASALARIRSDFVLDVVDVLRTNDGRTAIVTGLLEGEDLQRRLDRSQRVPPAEAIAIGRQVCRGLAAAHAASVVHRDLKPSNLFLEAAPDGRLAVKILDFGVAKLSGEDEMTRTGVVLGTPAYMAPEQARGSSSADPRSDVYAVGAVLYRMLTGRMPYEGADPGATLARLLIEPPPRPRSIAPDVPVALEVVIQRAMARDPAERPASALELEAALAALATLEDAPLASVGTMRPERDDPSTLALPQGTIERAEHIERDAKRARPLAALLAIVACIACGAATAALLGAIASWPDGALGAGEARVALSRALAIVGGLAGAIACAVGTARWLQPRWSSAPAVQHASARLAASVQIGLSLAGGSALLGLARAAIAGARFELSPAMILAVVAAAAIASLAALRRRA
ncbi:serine/threonine-protein kinase [Sandaracinus amylolyticus]|uniref:serine/threonine-protein kinase n=1 Tax=Sandaracinus amylolyticus TaxID=927083 RepID=UPI00069D08B0|nr:serine/threonine-protein kinase [Sandaracinus amylolyticus]